MTEAEPTPPNTHPPPKWATTFGLIWPMVISVVGLVACVVMLFNPELQNATAWMIFGGAAGILPVNRLLEALSVLGGKK